jgi:hypothetical protein
LVAHRSLTLAVLMPLARHRVAFDRQSRGNGWRLIDNRAAPGGV